MPFCGARRINNPVVDTVSMSLVRRKCVRLANSLEFWNWFHSILAAHLTPSASSSIEVVGIQVGLSRRVKDRIALVATVSLRECEGARAVVAPSQRLGWLAIRALVEVFAGGVLVRKKALAQRPLVCLAVAPESLQPDVVATTALLIVVAVAISHLSVHIIELWMHIVASDQGVEVVRKRLNPAWCANPRFAALGADTRASFLLIEGGELVVCGETAHKFARIDGRVCVFILNVIDRLPKLGPQVVSSALEDSRPLLLSIAADGVVFALTVRDALARGVNFWVFAIGRALVIWLFGDWNALLRVVLGHNTLARIHKRSSIDTVSPSTSADLSMAMVVITRASLITRQG